MVVFCMGILSVLFYKELFLFQERGIDQQMPALHCEKDNILIYSSIACLHCAKFHHRAAKLLNKIDLQKINVKYIDLSFNILDALGAAIVMYAKNPKQMREYIFKTQKMWLNENDILLSSRKLIYLCSRLEDVDLQKVYAKVPILLKETKDLCSSLGHEALPTILLVKKLEGVGALKNMTDIVQFGSLYVH